MDADALIADLDPEQRAAVTTPSSLVAVVAGAGSGKTRVLTRRVAYRIATGESDARHTLVLTFTREAAGELWRRLPRLGITERVESGTFHSVMLGLYRQYLTERGRRVPTVRNDRQRLLAETQHGNLEELIKEVNWACARGLGPDQYAAAVRSAGRRSSVPTTRVAEALADYTLTKKRRGVIDFDDVLDVMGQTLTRDTEYAEAIRWRFRHLLVDEAQDLNPLQQRLIDLIRADRDDLFLVGDPAQAVYGFNGADAAMLREVESHFPGIEVIRLPTNHRCSPQIVEAGVHVLQHDEPASSTSGRPDGVTVTLSSCADDVDEATHIATSVNRLDPTLVRSSSVAVLARTRRQFDAVSAALSEHGVPIRQKVTGSTSPLHPPLSAAGRLDSHGRLRSWAHDIVDDPDRSKLGEDHPDNLVAHAVLEFLRENPVGDGSGFRSWVSTSRPFEDHERSGVELLTFHAAKGREWNTVFVSGVETSLVPHRSASTSANRAEEARLLYVALTRATDRLVVTWARRRGGYQRKLSPFIDGFISTTPPLVRVPEELVPTPDPRRLRRDTLDDLHGWRERSARKAGIMPEALCTDAALRRIVDTPPRSPAELAELTGIGELTAGRLFASVRAALDAAPDQSRMSRTTGA